jgi:4-amino-4-deoxy-L-arabinose transferase-like glycosyltransferase
MKTKLQKQLFILIIAISFFVRFIGLSQVPPALNRDEAAIGYNAYSILKTGRDEHGQFFPLTFKSIGDYKMPLYIYATVFPVAFFGLNEFSIRFWSAFAGGASVIIIYYLVQLLLTETRFKPATIGRVSLAAAFFLALNPWAVFYSRVAFEANLSLALFLTGLYCFLKGFKTNLFFYLGLGLFLLAFLTYSSSLIFIPPFFAFGLLIWKNKLFQKKRLLPILLFIILAVFIFKSVGAVSSQKSNITIFSDPTIINYYNTTRTQIYQVNRFLARTWWNKKVFFLRLLTENYLKTFSPRFLVLEGGLHPWHRNPGVGNFYFIEIILALVGIWWLWRSPIPSWLKWFLLVWLLLAPLPSAITIDAPHSTRSLYLLPVLLIFASFGLVFLWQKLKTKRLILALIIFVYLINMVYAAGHYLKLYPQELASSVPWGLKQSLQFVMGENLKGKIYLTGIHDSIYLYPLVYTRFPPCQFQQEAVWTAPDLAGLTNAYLFGRFQIVDASQDIVNPQAVILSDKDNYFPSPPAFSSGRYRVYLFK